MASWDPRARKPHRRRVAQVIRVTETNAAEATTLPRKPALLHASLTGPPLCQRNMAVKPPVSRVQDIRNNALRALPGKPHRCSIFSRPATMMLYPLMRLGLLRHGSGKVPGNGIISSKRHAPSGVADKGLT